MPSDLQRVAQSLVECLDQMPNLVAHLQRLAAKCRENAGVIANFGSAQPSARTAALQLDAAAQACERADTWPHSHHPWLDSGRNRWSTAHGPLTAVPKTVARSQAVARSLVRASRC